MAVLFQFLKACLYIFVCYRWNAAFSQITLLNGEKQNVVSGPHRSPLYSTHYDPAAESLMGSVRWPAQRTVGL